MLEGKIVFISYEKRESNGKVYHNVNVEFDNGRLMRLGCDPSVVDLMEKYKSYIGHFEFGLFNNQMYMRLVGVSPVK